ARRLFIVLPRLFTIPSMHYVRRRSISLPGITTTVYRLPGWRDSRRKVFLTSVFRAGTIERWRAISCGGCSASIRRNDFATSLEHIEVLALLWSRDGFRGLTGPR